MPIFTPRNQTFKAVQFNGLSRETPEIVRLIHHEAPLFKTLVSGNNVTIYLASDPTNKIEVPHDSYIYVSSGIPFIVSQAEFLAQNKQIEP